MRIYADILKVLGDAKRLKLFALLVKSGEKYFVCELADAVGDLHCNTSRNLNELRKFGLVDEQKVGRGVMYFVRETNEPFLKALRDFVNGIPDEIISKELEILKRRVGSRINGFRCNSKSGANCKLEVFKQEDYGSGE
ncbi:MAG: hypothetical protein ABIM31_05110 [candidate division WOR-3 bacterium]